MTTQSLLTTVYNTVLPISQDARVGVKACEGLLLCASLSEAVCAHAILHDTQFCEQLTEQLCALYHKLPKVMDPGDIYCVQAKWGSVCSRGHMVIGGGGQCGHVIKVCQFASSVSSRCVTPHHMCVSVR